MTIEYAQRLLKLRNPDWDASLIARSYGYGEEALRFAEFDPSSPINRYLVEHKFISELGLLSVKLTAAELGLTEESVEQLVGFFVEDRSSSAVFPAQPLVDSSVLIKKDELPLWVREVTQYDGVWRSIPDRTEKIRDSIQTIFDRENAALSVEILRDTVYDSFKQAVEAVEGAYQVPPVAAAWCSITDQPISLPHAEYLALSGNLKPISLRPDLVGWHALLKDPTLEMHILGTLTKFRQFKAKCEDLELL